MGTLLKRLLYYGGSKIPSEPMFEPGDALLLETGDFFLLESGDKLLLEG
jgi:hypothetical protein